jgi:capsular polysaccharide transport system permease protein
MSVPQKALGGEPKPGVVIPIGKPAPTGAVRKKGFAAWLKRHWIRASALLIIGLPTLVTAVYLGLIASDRYAVEVKFAVRGQETPAVDALGVFGLGGGGGNMVGDSYILVDYIRSRSLWEEISKSLDLVSLYSAPHVDWLSRLTPAQPVERTIEYWRRMTQVSYEPATGIIRVEVSAFDKSAAVRISQAVTASAEALVNRLSTESRRDALKAATTEVERAEQRQRMLRNATRKFREREQISDPVRRAGFQQEMIEKSRAELTRVETELQSARTFMKEDAPTIVVLKNQRVALQKQVETLQKEVSGGDAVAAGGDPKGARTIATMLSNFEEIEAERHFAEKAYLTSLASLERARLEADRKQRYLAIFEKAEVPDEARYPARLRGVIVTLVASALIWGLLVMMVFGVREHV